MNTSPAALTQIEVVALCNFGDGFRLLGVTGEYNRNLQLAIIAPVMIGAH